MYDVKDTKAKFYKDYGDGNVSSSWDKVTTFYNKPGEKLFKFGLAFSKRCQKYTEKYFESEKEEVDNLQEKETRSIQTEVGW